MYVFYTSNRNLSSTFDKLHGTVLMVQVHLTFYVLTSRKGVKFRCSKSRGKKQKGINCVSLISLLLGTQQKGINCVSLIHKKLYRSPLPDKKGRRPRSKLCFHSYIYILYILSLFLLLMGEQCQGLEPLAPPGRGEIIHGSPSAPHTRLGSPLHALFWYHLPPLPPPPCWGLLRAPQLEDPLFQRF